jgi:hypothetical protein
MAAGCVPPVGVLNDRFSTIFAPEGELPEDSASDCAAALLAVSVAATTAIRLQRFIS